MHKLGGLWGDLYGEDAAIIKEGGDLMSALCKRQRPRRAYQTKDFMLTDGIKLSRVQ